MQCNSPIEMDQFEDLLDALAEASGAFSGLTVWFEQEDFPFSRNTRDDTHDTHDTHDTRYSYWNDGAEGVPPKVKAEEDDEGRYYTAVLWTNELAI